MTKLLRNFDLVAILILALVLGIARGAADRHGIFDIETEHRFRTLRIHGIERLIFNLPVLR
jgi:hypothetical protein